VPGGGCGCLAPCAGWRRRASGVAVRRWPVCARLPIPAPCVHRTRDRPADGHVGARMASVCARVCLQSVCVARSGRRVVPGHRLTGGPGGRSVRRIRHRPRRVCRGRCAGVYGCGCAVRRARHTGHRRSRPGVAHSGNGRGRAGVSTGTVRGAHTRVIRDASTWSTPFAGTPGVIPHRPGLIRRRVSAPRRRRRWRRRYMSRANGARRR